jgi:hypothetical protein
MVDIEVGMYEIPDALLEFRVRGIDLREIIRSKIFEFSHISRYL